MSFMLSEAKHLHALFSLWKPVLKSTSFECRDRTLFIILVAVELYNC